MQYRTGLPAIPEFEHHMVCSHDQDRFDFDADLTKFHRVPPHIFIAHI